MRLIDADALLKRVQQEESQAQIHGREFSTCFMSPGGTPSTEWWFVEDLIENAPTIEERKKGKWIKREIGWKCSNCTLCTNDRGADSFNYCPNCGADMRGDRDE